MSETGPGMGWLGLALILALLALIAWLTSRSRQERSGMPAGQIIYQDRAPSSSDQDTIFSPGLGLVGRPDYLVREGDGSIVPVEIKSSDAPARPYDGHVLQLAAYCLLVEEAYGIRPSHGILQYRDRSFAVDFTYELEADLLQLFEVMREDAVAEEVFRDHLEPARCAHCGFLDFCDDRLV